MTAPGVAGESVVVEWTGTALPGTSGAGSTCAPAGGADDTHDIVLTVPDGTYDALTVNATFHIEWDDADQDLVLSVQRDGVDEGASDGGSPSENVTLTNPAAGTLTAVVCPFAATAPTDYRASLTMTAIGAAACVAPPTSAKSHSTVTSSARNPANDELPGLIDFDRYRIDAAASPVAAPNGGYTGRLQNSLYDRTMGLPTFLWAQTDARAPAVGPLASERETLIARARAHLRVEAKKLKLTAAMIDSAQVFDAQYNGQGPAVVRFRQTFNGAEVFHRSLNVLLDRSGKPVAVSGYFATDYQASAVPALSASLSGTQAVAAAWNSLGGNLNALALAPAQLRDGYQWYSTPTLPGNYVFERAPRSKALYYPRVGGLEPAHYVELFARTRNGGQLIAYGLIVSARDGSILHRKNLIARAAYSYRVFAESDGIKQPFDAPVGNGYTPFPGRTPDDEVLRTSASQALVTLEAGPISTGDPWLPDAATETVGNNVDACLDTNDTAVNGTISSPANTCDPELGDMRGEPNGPNSFDYTTMADVDPSTPESKGAAVVNLFYMNNWLHDWWYDHGFNEAAGNAQTDNYGRGGADGDPIKAQGQDGSGRNNANMATPGDGSSPTMQQYLFDGPVIGEVRVTEPADSGELKFAAAAFGPDDYDFTAAVVLAADGAGDSETDGCGLAVPDPGLPVPPPPTPPAPQASLAGNIALIDRGNCNFTTKAQFALASGAVGMIVVNNADTAPIVMGNGDVPVSQVPVSPTDSAYQIPSVMIRKADGQVIKDQLAAGTVMAHMQRSPATDVDGTLDNQIIAHEFFHYVHNRLADVSSNQSRSMGEGWGDIDSFMLATRPDDLNAPNNANFSGAYGLAGYVVNNFYAGIRRAPYSTNFDINAFTFKHIADGEPTPDGGPGTINSEVHNSGEIWAEMMWECYVSLLNDPRYSFVQARDRMQDYIIGGLKMTPADATYTEARDAVLSVVRATDFQDYVGCSQGFAKRGAGLNAISPARDSADHVGVVEDYTAFVCGITNAGGGGGGAGGGGSGGGNALTGTDSGGALNLGLLLALLGLAGLRARRRG